MYVYIKQKNGISSTFDVDYAYVQDFFLICSHNFHTIIIDLDDISSYEICK